MKERFKVAKAVIGSGHFASSEMLSSIITGYGLSIYLFVGFFSWWSSMNLWKFSIRMYLFQFIKIIVYTTMPLRVATRRHLCPNLYNTYEQRVNLKLFSNIGRLPIQWEIVLTMKSNKLVNFVRKWSTFIYICKIWSAISTRDPSIDYFYISWYSHWTIYI